MNKPQTSEELLESEYRIKSRFKNHIATYWCDEDKLGTRIERLIFRRPDSGTDFIEYLSIGASLIVRGDLYEAIYGVSGTKTLSWWEGTQADYLSSKMRDLSGGRPSCSDIWDSGQADRRLAEFKEELMKNLREETNSEYENYKLDEGCEDVTYENWLSEHLDSLREHDDKQRQSPSHTYAFELKFWNELEPERYTSDEEEWVVFLREHGNDVFGDCHWETGIYNIGKRRNPMIDVHKEALDQALKQLREKGVALFSDATLR